MKFLSKWMQLENIILSEVTQSQKNTYVLIVKGILAQKLGIPKIQFTDQKMYLLFHVYMDIPECIWVHCWETVLYMVKVYYV